MKLITPIILLAALGGLGANSLAATAEIHSSDREIMRRCHDTVSDLRRTLDRAGYIASSGQLRKGASVLYTSLESKRVALSGISRDPENPHTVMAVRAAYDIAKTLMKTTAQEEARLGSNIVNQVRYSMMSELYSLVIYAYEDLDARYFGYPGLPMSYYHGVANLAGNFLNLQSMMAPMQGSDLIELKNSGVVAKSSKSILQNSVFRRDFSCTITDLAHLEQDIQQHLAGGGYMSTPQFVEYVRQEIANAKYGIPRCERSYYR